MSIEGFDSSEELAVVSAGDENLGARAYGGLEDGQGASGELMLLYLSDLIFAKVLLANIVVVVCVARTSTRCAASK